MKTTAVLILLTFALLCAATARADSFGSGGSAFGIDFVTIGNPGNADDTTGNPNPAGKVDYTFRMGTYEISEEMIDKAGLGITHNGRGADQPATSVSWYEAATFVNWLNVDAGGTPAYKFSGSTFVVWDVTDTADYDASNIYRSKRANYVLPSMDEWYKAAYYTTDLDKNGTHDDPGYYDYPTGSDTAPTAVASGATAGTAVYHQPSVTEPADITQAGGLSPYGTMGQGGNVSEWEETDIGLLNSSPGSYPRGVRGGFWSTSSQFLLSLSRSSSNPAIESTAYSFRVASIPEPSTLLLCAMGALGLLLRRRG